jgi:hypothetical protein
MVDMAVLELGKTLYRDEANFKSVLRDIPI